MNIKNYRVVKLGHGPDAPYALRKGWVFHRYKDLGIGEASWWGRHDGGFYACLGNYDKVKTFYDRYVSEKVIE